MVEGPLPKALKDLRFDIPEGVMAWIDLRVLVVTVEVVPIVTVVAVLVFTVFTVVVVVVVIVITLSCRHPDGSGEIGHVTTACKFGTTLSLEGFMY